MPRKKKTEQQQARQFGWMLPVILLVIGGITWWRGHETAAMVLAGIAVVVPPLAFGLPSVRLRFFRLWMKFAEALGWVMTRVILSVFYFLVMTPMGLVMRLLGKRPLDLKWKDGRSTYWIDKEPGEYTVERYEKQY